MRRATGVLLWIALTVAAACLGGSLMAQKVPAAKENIYVVKRVTVPSLQGMTRAEAGARLEAFDLQPAFEGAAEGTVQRQAPAGGASVVVQSTVTVVLASAAEKSERVRVPNLLKLEQKQAEATLEKDGLRVGAMQGPLSGRVARQSPSAGTMVAANTAVDLVLILPAPPVVDGEDDSAPGFDPNPAPPTSLRQTLKNSRLLPVAVVMIVVALVGAVWTARHPIGQKSPTCTLRTTRARTNIRNAGGSAPTVAMRVDLKDHRAATIITTRASEVFLKGTKPR